MKITDKQLARLVEAYKYAETFTAAELAAILPVFKPFAVWEPDTSIADPAFPNETENGDAFHAFTTYRNSEDFEVTDTAGEDYRITVSGFFTLETVNGEPVDTGRTAEDDAAITEFQILEII